MYSSSLLIDFIVFVASNYPTYCVHNNTSCDALLAYFKSDLLGGSSEHITWAEAAANSFVGTDVSRLINEGTPLEDRKNIILDEVLPNTFGPMITRLGQAAGLFGPNFPDKVAAHVKDAQDVFNKYDLGQLGDDIGLIFSNIPQNINAFKTAMECFSNDASAVNRKLEDPVTEDVDNQKFRAGILEAARLTSDLRDRLAQYLSRIVGA
ncbi:hypothetical protein QCA50_004667 [Cerrena zonata]|uniref:Uncharacterized protein n=1 Tax=Cerrena zonata TaxID=2478898 RepID=A0AAW0GHM0_9APHY